MKKWEADSSVPGLGKLLGHASPVTTNRYAHLIDDGAAGMAKSVADQLGL